MFRDFSSLQNQFLFFFFMFVFHHALTILPNFKKNGLTNRYNFVLYSNDSENFKLESATF